MAENKKFIKHCKSILKIFMENFETQPSEVKPTPLTTEKHNKSVDTYITFCKSGIFIIDYASI